MIIYGWSHFNRREHSLVRDTCRSCGRPGYLRSYTSSKFFTLYFIPVIPLGREKIVQECPHCKQAFGMSVRKWRGLTRDTLPKAVAAYEAAPGDAEAAKHLLGVCIGTQDRATVQRLGPQIRATFARDAGVLGMLAGTYSYLCLDREADAVYLDAIALDPDGSVAAEANAHLELQKLPRPTPPSRLLQSLPVLIVPSILLFVALGYLQRAVTGGLDDGYLVNGLDRPYTVVINGESVTLRPHVPVRSGAIDPGRNELGPGDDAAGLFEPQSFDVPVGIWDRMFGKTLAVVNPDRVGVISWERTGYAYPKAPDDVHQLRVNSGEIVHVFQDVDFPFVKFPDQISMSGSGVAYRTRVAEIGGKPIEQIAGMLAQDGEHDALGRHLRARLSAGMHETNTIHLASRVLPRDEFLGLARMEIAALPARIEWHRAYQSMLEGTPEGSDLVATYRALVDRHPEDSTLLYLYGRLLDDPVETVPVFEKAARLPRPSAYAANALVYHHLLEGDFPAAVLWSAEAVRLDAVNPSFRAMRVAALYGVHDYQAAEDETGDPLKAGDPRIAEFHAHIYRLAKLRRATEIPAEIDRFVKRARVVKEMVDSEESQVRAFLESAAALAKGERTKFAQCMKRLSGEGYAFQAAVVSGDLAGAQRIAGSAEWSTRDRLLLYALLARAGQAEPAANQLQLAIAALEQSSGDDRRWAAWLSAGEAPDVSIAAHACSDIEEQALYLTALATRHPERAADYLGRAERIRWADSYASLALASGATAP